VRRSETTGGGSGSDIDPLLIPNIYHYVKLCTTMAWLCPPRSANHRIVNLNFLKLVTHELYERLQAINL
jgi:hypothetical protein